MGSVTRYENGGFDLLGYFHKRAPLRKRMIPWFCGGLVAALPYPFFRGLSLGFVMAVFLFILLGVFTFLTLSAHLARMYFEKTIGLRCN